MGLDWVVQDKVDGTEPMATAGAKRLVSTDPEAVAAFREIWQANAETERKRRHIAEADNAHASQLRREILDEAYNDPDSSVPMDLMEAALSEEPPEAVPRDWDRPFETVLAESADKPGGWMPHTIPDDCPGLASVSGIAAGSLDFRGKIVANMQGLPRHLGEACFENMQPDEAMGLAEALGDYLDAVPGDRREFLEQACNWLMFWGSHGHPIYAWY